MSDMFLPDIPVLFLDNTSLSSSFKCFAYLLKMAALDFSSGSSNVTDRSILDSMAMSRSDFLFVAQINSTSEEDSKLSIFRRSDDKIRLLASCISLDRDPANASISSMKIIDLPKDFENSKASENFFSLFSKTHIQFIATITIFVNK